MTEASAIRKIEILKAATDPEISYREIGGRLDVSKGTISYTINEFCNIYQITELESDFPRKLLKFYNVGIPDGVTLLDDNDIRMLRRHVERVRRREVDSDEIETFPSDDNAYHQAQSINSNKNMSGAGAANPTWIDGKNYDTTTEDGLWRNILYKGKMANPQAIERFIGLYSLGKKQYEADPNSLLDLMRHQFGQGFGTDAFNLFMRNRGFYLGDLSGANTSIGTGGGGMNPMTMMMMMQMMNQGGGGQNMAQILPMLMGQGGAGGAGGGMPGNSNGDPMSNMFMVMMMQSMQKEQEKKDKQEQFDQMMNMMMIKMIGGTMDSRTPMDAASGQFMVQEVLDKDRNVKERHLLPMGMAMQNPMMMGSMFGKSSADETTQMVLKNALDEKSRAWEIMASSQAPMNQILMTLIGNFQSKNDPVAQFAQLMDIREKYLPAGGQPDPNIERMKIDLQLALNQQNLQLEQMKHQWDLERIEKEQSGENVKNWMGMISDVGTKLAGPITQVVASSMGGAGGGLGAKLGGNEGPGGPTGLPPLGSGPQPPSPGGLTPPVQQQQQRKPSGDGMGVTIGVPDPDHNEYQLQQNQPDPAFMMRLMEAEKAKQQNVLMAQEIERLRGLVISNNAEHVRQEHIQRPVEIDKDKLSKMPDEQIKEILDNLKANGDNVQHTVHLLENELADREWLTAPGSQSDDDEEPEELTEAPHQEVTMARAVTIKKTKKLKAKDDVIGDDGVPLIESLEESHVDDIDEQPISDTELEDNLPAKEDNEH